MADIVVDRFSRSRTGQPVWVKAVSIKSTREAALLGVRIRALEKRTSALELDMERDAASGFTETRGIASARHLLVNKLMSFLIKWGDSLAFARNARMRVTALINRITAMFAKYDGARAAFLLLITDVE
jgi:hypothetical protein